MSQQNLPDKNKTILKKTVFEISFSFFGQTPKAFLRVFNASIYKVLSLKAPKLIRKLHDQKGKKPFRIVGIGHFLERSYKRIEANNITFSVELFGPLVDLDIKGVSIEDDFSGFEGIVKVSEKKQIHEFEDLKTEIFEMKSPLLCQGKTRNNPMMAFQFALEECILSYFPGSGHLIEEIELSIGKEKEIFIAGKAKHQAYWADIRGLSTKANELLSYGCFMGLGAKKTFGFGELGPQLDL